MEFSGTGDPFQRRNAWCSRTSSSDVVTLLVTKVIAENDRTQIKGVLLVCDNKEKVLSNTIPLPNRWYCFSRDEGLRMSLSRRPFLYLYLHPGGGKEGPSHEQTLTMKVDCFLARPK